MIKRNKIKLIISSLIILLPTLISFFGSKFLPEKIAVHWGFDGNPDGLMSPKSIFLILPLILLAIHWMCLLIEATINKNNEQNKKIIEITFWIIPIISLVSSGTILAAALGYTPNNIFTIILLLLSVMFITIGNYMPKTTRNITAGIKIRWTVSNDDNWRATHRFSGKLYVFTGLILLLAIPLPSASFPFVAISIILVTVLAPIIYSYAFYKKQLREGSATKEDYKNGYKEIVSPKNQKAAIIVSVVLTAVIVITLPLVMFTGDINTTLDDSSLKIEASFSSDIILNYEDIDSVEYRENGADGTRVVGFASGRLLMGSFENKEFGIYTRYTYTGKGPCVVLKSGEQIFVIGLDTPETTKALYEELSDKISE